MKKIISDLRITRAVTALFLAGCLLGFSGGGSAAGPGTATTADLESPEARVLTIGDFIRLASKNDTVFEQILIDELKLQYRRDLLLPGRDIILSVKGQYDFILNQKREDPEVAVGLDKLFPGSGTHVSVSYENIPSVSSTTEKSRMDFLISQPIAENAFGHATRLQDKITGIEIDVIRYQITEAYEDYLASLINIYYNWYSAYENLKIGKSSYEQNKQLLDNMNRRAASKIALPVDVNKVQLLVIAKEENMISLKEAYNNHTNLVITAIRADDKIEWVPQDPSGFHDFEVDFEEGYRQFTTSSRTYAILKLLEEKSTLDVKKNADDLLPSTNLLLGYTVEGTRWGIKDEDNMVYAGVSLEWPFPGQKDRAEHKTAEIDLQKTRLTHQNKYLELYTDLRNLHLKISREKELIRLTDEKIKLSEAVLTDETRNYSFGKISLNDYIDAVNTVDVNKFNKIIHIVELKKLLLEWLRLTDHLVDKARGHGH